MRTLWAVPGLVLYLGVMGASLLMGGLPVLRAWMARQRWLRPMVAALAMVQAMALVAAGFMQPGVGGAAAVLAVACGWVTGPLLGRVLRLEQAVQRPLQWAARRLGDYPGLAGREAFRVLTVLLAVNPAGWLAGWNAGLADDMRGIAWKGLLDGITLLTMARWRPGWAAPAVAVAASVQGVPTLLGHACRPWMDRHGLIGPALMASGLVWLTLPLLVLGIRRVPLLSLMASVPATVLFAAWFR